MISYATNAIESINAQLYKIIKTRGQFPSDEAAIKLIWLPLRNITADWGLPAHNKEATNSRPLRRAVHKGSNEIRFEP